MPENLRTTTLRFNLNKELHRKAWDYLQRMDKAQFKSYTQVVSLALIEFFERYYKGQDDPYFESRAQEERFVTQIVEAVEREMQQQLPLFLAGCMTGIVQTAPPPLAPQPVTVPEATKEEVPDIDWTFLGD